MKIRRRNLLARIYIFNFLFWSDEVAPMQTDLCHFMRVVLLWLPLKILTILFLAFVAAWVGFVLPITALGFPFFLTVVLLSISIGYLIVRLCTHEYHWQKSETVGIVFAYGHAIKDKVCPLVEIEDTRMEANDEKNTVRHR